jgi:hypothetical protein
MRQTDNNSDVPSPTDSHIRDFLLAALSGRSPTTGIARSDSSVVRTNSVAAALAVLPGKDDSPRVIRQFTSIFLVSRAGELWRVYDAASTDNLDRQMPSPSSQFPYRIFLALARDEQTRVYRLVQREPRDIDPVVLQQQLDDSVTV